MDASTERSHRLGSARPHEPRADASASAGGRSSSSGDRAHEVAIRRASLLIGIAGFAVLVYVTRDSGLEQVQGSLATYWLLTLFVGLGELFPIELSRMADDGPVGDEITTSTTFAFAILLIYGTGPAAVSLALASALADAWRRKRPVRILFNVGLYTLSIAAAGVVYGWLGAPQSVSIASLGAIAASAFTFFFVNELLMTIWIAVGEGTPSFRTLAGDLLFQAWTAAVLLAMAPIVVVVVNRSPFLLPLFIGPAAALYWGAKESTENHRLVAKLEVSNAHLRELNRLKDDFVAVVSHELRTPLTSIQGYVKTMIQLGDRLESGQQRSFLEAADRQSDRLRRLIEQLLVVARLESHVEPLTVSEVSIASLTNLIVDELHSTAHGHTFDLRFDESLPVVRTDEAKVHQILSNLLENALKYSPPDTRVTVREQMQPDGVIVSVEDEGPGIPSDQRDRIFDRFFQVDQSSTRVVGGTGLGLYICKKMAETIGARLWLERSDRTGSAFCLWLPFDPPEDEILDPLDEEPRPTDTEVRGGAKRPAGDQSMTASV